MRLFVVCALFGSSIPIGAVGGGSGSVGLIALALGLCLAGVVWTVRS